jgi:hypothetical protein
MSHRRPSPPSFYVAVWAEAAVVKPGYSSATRWRHWENRGANIAILRHFDHFEDASALETVAFEAMWERWPLAFGSELESRVLLGRHGGWRETFRAPADDAVRMLIRIADAYATPGCGLRMRGTLPHGIATYERTNELTNGSKTREPSVTLSDAHVRIRRCGVEVGSR